MFCCHFLHVSSLLLLSWCLFHLVKNFIIRSFCSMADFDIQKFIMYWYTLWIFECQNQPCYRRIWFNIKFLTKWKRHHDNSSNALRISSPGIISLTVSRHKITSLYSVTLSFMYLFFFVIAGSNCWNYCSHCGAESLFNCRLKAMYCIDFLGRKINLSRISPAKCIRSGQNLVYVDRSRGDDNVHGILGQGVMTTFREFWPKWGLGRVPQSPSFFCLVNHATFRQVRNRRFSQNLITKRMLYGL